MACAVRLRRENIYSRDTRSRSRPTQELVFSSLVFKRAPKSANDNTAGSIIGGPFHLIVDVEDELRHIVVPIERNNGLRASLRR